jgi:hypothetical protein
VCNSNIFKDVDIPSKISANQIINIMKEFKVMKKEKKPWISIMPVLDMDTPWGFFYEASQGNPTSCGVGVVMYITQSHYMHI